jgi:hypothetical protein
MSGHELVLALATAGLEPHWSGGRLLLRGNPASYTPELRAAMKEHRAWLEHELRPMDADEDVTGWDDPRLVDAVAWPSSRILTCIL